MDRYDDLCSRVYLYLCRRMHTDICQAIYPFLVLFIVDSKRSIADHTGYSADSRGPEANSREVVNSDIRFADAPAATSTGSGAGMTGRMDESRDNPALAVGEHSKIEERNCEGIEL